MATDKVKVKPLGQVVEEGFKAKQRGSFEAGAVTIQQRGNRVDIVPTTPIEPAAEVEVKTDGSDLP